MTDLIIKFDRIGRSGTTPEAALTLHVPEAFADDPQRIAEFVFPHVRRHLVSSEFMVTVDLEKRAVLIDGGRFGGGRILEAV